MHLKKGDKVRVISGKDKGKTGVILASLPDKERVLVEGVSIVKKHTKPNQENPQGYAARSKNRRTYSRRVYTRRKRNQRC